MDPLNLSPPAETANFEPEEAAGSYWRALAHHWRLVLLVTLLAIGVAAYTVHSRVSRYQASASVLVSPLPQTNADFVGSGAIIDSADPARTVQTAASLLSSPTAAATAANAMGAGWSPQRVARSVSITPRGQSDVLAVTATAPSGAEAQRLANAYANAAVAARGAVVQRNITSELASLRSQQVRAPSGALTPEQQTFGERINQLQAVKDTGRDPTVSVSELATAPGTRTGAPAWLILLLSGLAGIALGSVAALAIEYFSRTVRDEHDVSALFQVPLLAGIPNVKRRGGPLSPQTMPPLAFEQLRLLRTQLMSQHNVQVIMVTSADAADGKTTVATALAGAFGEGAEDVIVLDLDVINPDAGRALGLGDDFASINDYSPSNSNGKPSLSKMLVPVPGLPRVKVLPAKPGDMATLESLIGWLPDLLEEATQLADWVIIDTAPVGEVSHSLRIAPQCDAVVMVVRARHTDRSRLMLARDLVLRSGANLVGAVLVGQSITKPSGYYYTYAEAASAQSREKALQRLLRSGQR